MSHMYIAVMTRSPQKTIEAYLYSQSRIVVVVPSVDRTLVVVRAPILGGWNAVAQAERLRSGLHSSSVHETLQGAVEHLFEFETGEKL